MARPELSVCEQCGACCAAFRVSFYWAEATRGGLPDELVEPVHKHLACMAGTNQPAPRCNALQGEVGKEVRCLVYAARPSPCREVQPGSEKCNKARARFGLSAISDMDTTTD